MSNHETSNGFGDLQPAFRRAHFLDHILPVGHEQALTRAQTLEASMVASGISQADIDEARKQALGDSVSDFNAYLAGGIRGLEFDERFVANVCLRIFEAHQMGREVVLPEQQKNESI